MPSDDADHFCELMNAVYREREQFDAFLAGVGVGANLPIGELSREEFRERVHEHWDSYREGNDAE